MTPDDPARRLARHLQTLIEEAENADRRDPVLRDKLSPQEIRVLRTVGGKECCVMSAIAQGIRLSLSTVTGLIDRLCEKKLVRRDRSVEDRRVVQVELTPEGKELHAAAFESRVALAREVLQGLDAADQEVFVRLMEKASGALAAKPPA